MNNISQRDLFLSELLSIAKKDPNVILISPDMGAPTIDLWKSEVPSQFFSVGISEQNAINVAAGMASVGKKVYVYFMACWCCRCLEQIRYSCAIANNPITILGCGVGLGYAPAGPAHNPTDDMTYMRAICNIEIFSPATNEVVKQLVNYTYTNKKLVYVRLERNYDNSLDTLYTNFDLKESDGIYKLHSFLTPHGCIVSSGYLLGRATQISGILNMDLYDMYRLKPDVGEFKKHFKNYKFIVSLEEQTPSGGFSSVLAESIVKNKINAHFLGLGLPEMYILENGTRDELLDKYGLSVNELCFKINDINLEILGE